jgi:DNA-binding transcriptional regulator YiaG
MARDPVKVNIATLVKQHTQVQLRILREQVGQQRARIEELERTVLELRRAVAPLRTEVAPPEPSAAGKQRAFTYSRHRLVDHRRKLGLSMDHYALLVGVTSGCISLWEQGQTQPLRRRWPALARVMRMNRAAARRELGLQA